MAADLILNNPFRVLGLSATAGARDIAKRISDLETFAELGKTKAYPLDFEVLGPIDRGLEAIKDAARRIEQTEGRLFHSFFWFRSADSVDALALESLRDSSVYEALDLWEKQLSKKGKKQYTWRLNRSVLRLVLSSEQGFDREEFDNALEDLGFVIDDHLHDSIEDVLGGTDSGINCESLWKKIVDELLLIVKAAPNAPYGAHSAQIIDSFWSFPQEAKDYVTSKIINPLAEAVLNAIQNSVQSRSDKAQLETLKRKNGLDKVEYIITELERTLGEESPKFQSIANAYANELCSCAVAALNEYEDIALASMYIEWAETMPSFARIKSRIEENKENIESWVESKEQEELNAAAVAKQRSYRQSIEEMLKAIRSRASSKGAVKESVNALFERLDICEYQGDRWDEDLNDDDFRSSLAFNVRSLAIDIYNDYELLDSALQIAEKLVEVFFDLAEVSEKLEKDIETLRGIRKNQEDARQRSIQRDKEITYEAEIGLVFKDTLRISPNGVEWKGQRFPLESITGIRWGAVSNSINGIPTGTDYTIAFGDARSSAIVQTRRKEVYDSTTDRLWKAVGIRLIEGTLQLLRNGKTITFGGAVIDDKGVQLTKRGFFSKENVYREWAQVTYNSYNGSLFFVDKNDSKVNLELSYLTTWNAHLLEAIVRLSYKKGLGRLSSSLD